MATKKQHLESLKNVSLFGKCSARDLERVAKLSTEVTLEAGTLIMDQGQVGREAVVVVEGEVTVKRNGRKIATLGPGDIVGEMALLDHGPRTASVSAASEVTALVIDGREFLALVDEVPAIAQKLLAVLAARVREFDRQTYG